MVEHGERCAISKVVEAALKKVLGKMTDERCIREFGLTELETAELKQFYFKLMEKNRNEKRPGCIYT